MLANVNFAVELVASAPVTSQSELANLCRSIRRNTHSPDPVSDIQF